MGLENASMQIAISCYHEDRQAFWPHLVNNLGRDFSHHPPNFISSLSALRPMASVCCISVASFRIG